MTTDKTNFARLMRLQRVIKSMRERDHADAKNRVASAEKSLEDLSRMINEESAVASLFPDLLARHFEKMMAEKHIAARQEQEAADDLVREKKKLETIEGRHTAQKAQEAREAEAKSHSEAIDQRYVRPVSASSKIGGIR
ncbi:hypothetical protein [Oricola cellulosilytica]|uniref:Flagellar export protein FliJ n=1 Tax=Oricola cellulosilytica TaxID=1429082 RepID=A0A4R0PGN5_9HYPH|nr:hypothetical protein [Oricola cellulosilytica]TCD16228.1 hypothetical protein E0D97_02005 [Oricola cellulosilytica]